MPDRLTFDFSLHWRHSMRYVDHGAGGPAEVMRLAQAPQPVPRAGEVLIAVRYAGVNRPELYQRSGVYPPPPGASPVLGLEVSGRIAAVGDGVSRWRPGDLVCALTPGGGYADYCVAPEGSCLPIPPGLTEQEAAGLPENYFTVWSNVFDRAHLKAGERFLVHGGTSGIGLTAIQMAKAFGATVFTTAGTDEKVAFCLAAGADLAWNYRDEDWTKGVWNATQKHGVNVILDSIGGDYIMKNIRCLAVEGRLVQIGFMAGSKIANFDAMYVMIRRLTIMGSTLRARSFEDKAAIAQALERHVWPLFNAGRLKPRVHAIFPLEQVIEAHRLMESSTHIGKIILEVNASA